MPIGKAASLNGKDPAAVATLIVGGVTAKVIVATNGQLFILTQIATGVQIEAREPAIVLVEEIVITEVSP